MDVPDRDRSHPPPSENFIESLPAPENLDSHHLPLFTGCDPALSILFMAEKGRRIIPAVLPLGYMMERSPAPDRAMKTDNLPPCAADALRKVRQVMIDGHPIGIMKLDECIATVRAERLTSDEEIQAALVKAVKAYNYIPRPVEAEYARVFLEEYRKSALKNDRR
jgi:hypothetical protein